MRLRIILNYAKTLFLLVFSLQKNEQKQGPRDQIGGLDNRSGDLRAS
jgi:hypothetical protein